jgi:hypothetical protein
MKGDANVCKGAAEVGFCYHSVILYILPLGLLGMCIKNVELLRLPAAIGIASNSIPMPAAP